MENLHSLLLVGTLVVSRFQLVLGLEQRDRVHSNATKSHPAVAYSYDTPVQNHLKKWVFRLSVTKIETTVRTSNQ
eukprot:CAMPEP_0203755782 /NCGR_PEP_ID=MMETSP0098-20131031/9167_1 /ASSEMBLY_ACC=CAM_ASM_000208 /TAXON_ID=96639 /ORGANISM=" , Strain NY0313808BC1" /LENGTH=74 /DNA_ID=CAMNT_0050647377 /DNA_START=602 /DNA_END=823 /DNA_ORIENTATION=+